MTPSSVVRLGGSISSPVENRLQVLLRSNANIRINIGTTSAVVPTVGAAYRITPASLVPGLELTDEEVEDLSGYLPSFIATFIQDRRVTLEVP